MIKFSATNWVDDLVKMKDQAGAAISANPTAYGAGIGGVAGGLLAGGTSMATKSPQGENPADRRRRILRNALMGTALGAGAGASASSLPDIINNFMPARTPEGEANERVQQAFGPGSFMHGMKSRLLMGAGYLGLNQKYHDAKDTASIKGKAGDWLRQFGEASGKATAEGTATAKSEIEGNMAKVVQQNQEVQKVVRQMSKEYIASNTTPADPTAGTPAVPRFTQADLDAFEAQAAAKVRAATFPGQSGAVPYSQADTLRREAEAIRNAQRAHLGGLTSDFQNNWGKTQVGRTRSPFSWNTVRNAISGNPVSVTNPQARDMDPEKLMEWLAKAKTTNGLAAHMGRNNYTGAAPSGFRGLGRTRLPGWMGLGATLFLPEIARLAGAGLSTASDLTYNK